MDWCWYLAVKILGMTEEEFYKATPRKLFKLAEIHREISNPKGIDTKSNKSKPVEKYIDQLSL